MLQVPTNTMSNAIKPTNLTLHVTIKVAPENIESFLEALRPCWQGCLDEPECIFFDVFHDPANPGTFKFVECWTESEKWFREVQWNRPYYGPYTEITKPMWLEPREVLFFERVDGWSFADDRYLAGRVNS